jgi:hypothetical protein
MERTLLSMRTVLRSLSIALFLIATVNTARLFGQTIPISQLSEDKAAALGESALCPREEVISGVILHARELVENVNRFTATESLENERLNHSGKLEEKVHSKSKYVATIQKEDGVFVVNEYRELPQRMRNFPLYVSSTGAVALALIFHPSHVEEFDMSCVGSKEWHGQIVWQVDFQQRKDRPVTMSGIQIGRDFFPLFLNGFALVDRDTRQIVHIEADLADPIPQAKLELEHQSADYGSVPFTQRDISLWLPQLAEVTVGIGGKKLVERHTFSEYQLFFVDTGQKIGKPKDSAN